MPLTGNNDKHQDDELEHGKKLVQTCKRSQYAGRCALLTFISQTPVRGVKPCRSVTKKITAQR